MNKIKYRNYFLSKTQWSLTCAENVLLCFEFHDVKTETSMSCKQRSDKLSTYTIYKKWKHMILIFI